MQLTKEYFDKGIANLLETITGRMATKDDLAAIREEMVTKADLKVQLDSQTQGLNAYVDEAFEHHQNWTEERLKEFAITYDVRDRVKKLEKDVAHLKLKIV